MPRDPFRGYELETRVFTPGRFYVGQVTGHLVCDGPNTGRTWNRIVTKRVGGIEQKPRTFPFNTKEELEETLVAGSIPEDDWFVQVIDGSQFDPIQAWQLKVGGSYMAQVITWHYGHGYLVRLLDDGDMSVGIPGGCVVLAPDGTGIEGYPLIHLVEQAWPEDGDADTDELQFNTPELVGLFETLLDMRDAHVAKAVRADQKQRESGFRAKLDKQRA